jgi:hypothetical protein
MKITVELSEKDLKDVRRFSGEKKKGPAIRKFIVTELMLKRRREISQKILAGEWSAELPSIDRLRQDRKVWER